MIVFAKVIMWLTPAWLVPAGVLIAAAAAFVIYQLTTQKKGR